MKLNFKYGQVDRFESGNATGDAWGAETSDRRSFFTSTETSLNCKIQNKGTREPGDGVCALSAVEVEMEEGRWHLDQTVKYEGGVLYRTQLLRVLEASVFQDFVMRFKFSKDSFDHAVISGKKICHNNLNIYHQFPIDQVRLVNEIQSINIKVVQVETSGKFRQELYVRDEPRHWIVHVRLMPVFPPDIYWFRWRNRIFNLSLGQKLSALLCYFSGMREFLWLLSERRGGRPQLQAQGLSYLNAGDVLMISCSLTDSRPGNGI